MDGRAGDNRIGDMAAWMPEITLLYNAPVAQLDRVLPSEGRGHRFESCRARQPYSYALNSTRYEIATISNRFDRIVGNDFGRRRADPAGASHGRQEHNPVGAALARPCALRHLCALHIARHL